MTTRPRRPPTEGSAVAPGEQPRQEWLVAPEGERVFEVAARYLLANGWWRDGDDLGIWIDPGPNEPPYRTMPEALAIQWARDGIDMEQALPDRPTG